MLMLICNVLINSTRMSRTRNALEKSCRTQKWTGHSQSLTQAAWHDHGSGLKMAMDTECTSIWTLSTNCTLVISQIFSLRDIKIADGLECYSLSFMLHESTCLLVFRTQLLQSFLGLSS